MPSVRILASMNSSSDVGFSSAFVSWNRKVLLALPPPFVMTRKSYESPSTAERSICAGRFEPVLTSSYIDDRRHLGVPQVGLRVGAEHAPGEGLLVASG